MICLKRVRFKQIILFCLVISFLLSCSSFAAPLLMDRLQCLKQAYPDKIQSVNQDYITWDDGTKMYLTSENSEKTFLEKLVSPTLLDQLEQTEYPVGQSFQLEDDPGRIRYEPFFRKMYGNSAQEVSSKLKLVYWMSNTFGKQYPLGVTTINSVDKKILKISHELDELIKIHPEFRKYLEKPGGFFKWRKIAGTNRLSSHSFGIAIDINTTYSDYWQWDLKRQGLPIEEKSKLKYNNKIPWKIVDIFEKNGFIWGGKWRHYDTMHFEYRPELLIKGNCLDGLLPKS